MSAPLVRLPSLDLVRGFVAVGRRMSITLAAQDLCLTQSAVSRQIHALEDALGLKLLPNLLALDSGCLWGGHLTAVRLEDRRVFQVDCSAGEVQPLRR